MSASTLEDAKDTVREARRAADLAQAEEEAARTHLGVMEQQRAEANETLTAAYRRMIALAESDDEPVAVEADPAWRDTLSTTAPALPSWVARR